MRLSGLLIKNYRRIGATECCIKIDEIVVLIGQNNAGKSTVLDAYEAFASGGKELDESHFNNENPDQNIEITGIFSGISTDDEAVIGKKWSHHDPEYDQCIKVRWIWKKPNEKAQKQSFNPETNQFEDGGVGGWDSLIQSRIPQPIRIRPTDPVETTQTKIVGMLKEHVKSRLKADSTSTKAVFDEIDRLTNKLFDEAKSAFDEVAQKITTNVSQVFPGTTIELIPKSKDAIDEKIVGAESYLRVGTELGAHTPLLLQGTGIQRALLWSALAVMADVGGAKKKPKTNSDGGRILLIDEPEAFLHPPTIRNARDSLYEFALNNPDWQVLATTHSPIFIDLSRDHTTIVRVDASSSTQKFVSTDKISFDAPERTRLQMVRACHPVVNEFFFYDNIVLVEGPTEQIVVNHIASAIGVDVHVINCLGKANIPLFARILNQFQVPYLAVHDSDTPKVKRKEKMISGAMWSINESIRDVVSESYGGRIFTQFPHFEGEFLGESLSAGKVDRILEILSDPSSNEYRLIFDTYSKAINNNDASILTTTKEAFEAKCASYVSKNGLENSPLWV
ncbi:ATP-dependent nuclease [Chitinimonas taiwanensis]|uniref:ATP-dependent nuclease n=1 Tax=Chitinimonas taiwanensis TaxID=240412 RepID=UPI0035B2A875